MAKKDLGAVGALAPLAKEYPTQRAASEPLKTSRRAGEGEPILQFSLSLRKSLRKQLMRLASDADMTMRAFVLNALKDKGLEVQPEDLLDLRRERP
jgi:hypothetical protein